jgi:hypothetical protein
MTPAEIVEDAAGSIVEIKIISTQRKSAHISAAWPKEILLRTELPSRSGNPILLTPTVIRLKPDGLIALPCQPELTYSGSKEDMPNTSRQTEIKHVKCLCGRKSYKEKGAQHSHAPKNRILTRGWTGNN